MALWSKGLAQCLKRNLPRLSKATGLAFVQPGSSSSFVIAAEVEITIQKMRKVTE